MTYSIELDPTAAAFYEKVAAAAGVTIQQVLADSLYKLAGSLSLDAIVKASGK